MPGILSLYIARRFSAALLLILFAVGVVIFLADYVEVLRRFSGEYGFTAATGLRLVFMRLPYLLDTVLPFAFLFAALLSLLSLSRKLELVVARASGVSVWGFLRPPMAVAVLFGAAAAFLLNPAAVQLEQSAERLEAQLSESGDRSDSGRWFRQEGPEGPSILFSGGVDEEELRLFGVTAFTFDQAGAFREKVLADEAIYESGRWLLPNAEVVSAVSAPRQVDAYDLPTDLSAEEIRRSIALPEAVSVWSLPGFIKTAQSTGVNADRFRLAFHALINRPLFFLAMVLIAANVSLRLTRYGGTWRLILTGVGAGFLLYVFTEIVSDLGANGVINPILAAWLPSIVALTFGATALLYQEDG